MTVEAGLAGPCPIVRLDPAGKSHEEEAPQFRLRPEAARRLESIETGQPDVEDRDVGAQAPRRVDGGRAIVRDVRLVPLERQELGERESGLDVVVEPVAKALSGLWTERAAVGLELRAQQHSRPRSSNAVPAPKRRKRTGRSSASPLTSVLRSP